MRTKPCPKRIESVSRKRLVAAVDERELATASEGEGAAATADAKRIYDRWAEIIRNRLAALRDFDASQKPAERAMRFHPTGGTQVDGGTAGHRFGIGQATREATLGTLGLG